MSLSTTTINRPVLATVMSLLIVIFGAIGYSSLGVRDYPSVDNPVISVRCSFSGANADVIETQITEPLEAAVNGIPGIRAISSTSRDGSSSINIEFNLEVDLETAANDVRDKVSGAMRRLPQDVDPPVVEKSDADAQPIYTITLQSKTRDIIDLSEFAEVNFKERLQTISGVSNVGVWGSKRYSVRMRMDPILLAAYRITPLDVRQAVTRENVELPSGTIEGSTMELTVRTLGRLRSIEDFNNLIIYRSGERVVRFSDIGVAEVEAENTRSILKRDGIPMVALVLIPQPGANYINIVDDAVKAVEELKKSLPDDIEVGVGFDNTIFIRDSISEVKFTIFQAFILVVLIIFLFLRNWRTTLIPIIAIPISLVGAFFVMYLAGFSINILTLLALVLAIGLVVDDAIVVMENIYTKIEKGVNPKEAAIQGSKEIFFAVIATTVTLVAVFFPIVFLQGVTGRLFREFSIVIAGAVMISSFVALTFTPMISSKLLKQGASEGRFYKFSEPFFKWLNGLYARSLAAFMRKRWLAIVFLVGSLGFILYMWTSIPSEMAPLEDRSMINVSSTAQEGATFDYMLKYTDQMYELLDNEVEEKDRIMQMVGMGGRNRANFQVSLVSPLDRDRTQQEIADELSPKVARLTGARSFVNQQQTFGGRRGGMPVQYVIQAKNLDSLKVVIPIFMSEVAQSEVFANSDINLRFTKPELSVNIDRDKASMMGVSIQNIAQTLQLSMSEQRIGYFIRNGKQYQIISQIDQSMRNKPVDLANIYVRNDMGELIQLDNLIKMEESSTPPQLFRYNRFVSATVSASLSKGYTLGQGIAEMDKIADRVLNPDNFSTALSGQSKDFVESTSSLLFAFILALILIYLVLAAQFESFRDPLIIMLTVPLALIGALITLKFNAQTLNIFSQIGLIMLIGLVSKNGILMVEFANQRKLAGLKKFDAIMDSAASRFRPILMTSLSTILGVAPMAFATGAGAESRISMGLTVAGGLIFSTLFTLYIIPAMYSYISSSKANFIEKT
ncbi:MAG: acriflavin resistance protein [Bacteroidetes bacterium GWE2_39_28]|nr:MAG: acriflavin resistance protein [Bacteroidetes bacterium GWE2_39_28]OFY12443.1 MAG: acriflavin resistance protein [Bacteroidetes bacterium GWF2_39_10]OFZ08303.1 MAG: acriflavin resistance protein [Bacteroidetes bacterium RIFOXYB2_FULL_39_7]OFZ11512.1 MAG: acriflavin resistance protein [Bacteroidetes bacterium RIFOXYC2_FULL_39_11]HCT93387.1 acriflavin resistance protein [Rikenellaceae bacterium]